MIEIKPYGHSERDVSQLYINGEVIDLMKAIANVSKDGSYSLTVRDAEISKKLLSYKPSEFPRRLEYMSLPLRSEQLHFLDSISIYHSWKKVKDKTERLGYRLVDYKNKFELSIVFKPDLSQWKADFNFAQYYEEFLKINKRERRKVKFNTYNNERTPFLVTIEGVTSIVVSKLPFENEVNKWIDLLVSTFKEAESNLASQNQANSLRIAFDFPDEVKAPCEQYLIYFSQFLRDLGVKATSDLSHEAGQVLFTVTPENPEQALDKIRAALDVYLQLPSSPIDTYPDASTEIELQRHIANIQHLKGQLSLVRAELRAAESTIELKDTTIQLLQLTVDQQKRLLSGDISGSMKDVTPRKKASDKEDLIEGIISLKTYDAKVAEVNIAEIWRRLKKLFKEK